jgi:hypothetical protein
MAKNYKRGLEYILYYMSAGTFSSPTWTAVPGVGDLAIDPQYGDIEVPERGQDTGHLQGAGNPKFTFTLFEDTGDTSVTAIIAAIFSGASVTLGVANGPVATTGTNLYKMECLITGNNKANRGDVAQWDIEAMRHANSSNTITKVTSA